MAKTLIVKAVAGDDSASGKTGKVLRVFHAEGRALVEGLNFVTKHLRKSQDNPKGGIIQKEAPIAVSNLAVVTPAEGKERSRHQEKTA